MSDKNSLPIFSGQKLKKIMKEKELTIYDIATGAGISPSSVSKYLNGKVNPRPKAIRKIADFLNVDPGFFLDGAFKSEESVYTSLNIGDGLLGKSDPLSNKFIDELTEGMTNNIILKLVEQEVLLHPSMTHAKGESEYISILLDSMESELLGYFRALPEAGQIEVLNFAKFKAKE